MSKNAIHGLLEVIRDNEICRRVASRMMMLLYMSNHLHEVQDYDRFDGERNQLRPICV